MCLCKVAYGAESQVMLKDLSMWTMANQLQLNLEETYVVQSFRRNLIFISTLDKFGYYCLFRNNKFNLF